MTTKRYIISGGPGSGKTTLVQHLRLLGYPTVRETAREIIEWNLERGGKILPWIDRDLFDAHLVDICAEDYARTSAFEIVFFDGCMLDVVPWRVHLEQNTNKYEALIGEFSFDQNVFVPEPWDAIHFSNSARPFSFDDCISITEKIANFYRKHDFKVTMVPPMSPIKRTRYVLSALGLDPQVE